MNLKKMFMDMMNKISLFVLGMLLETISISQSQFSLSAGPNYFFSNKSNSTSHIYGKIRSKIGYEVNLNTRFNGKLEKLNFSLGFNQINFHNNIYSGSLGSGMEYDADFHLGRAQISTSYYLGWPTHGFLLGLFYNYKAFEKAKGTKTYSSISSGTQIIELNGKSSEYLKNEFGIRASYCFIYLFPGSGDLAFNFSLNYQLNINSTLSFYDYNNAFNHYVGITIGHGI